MIGKKGMKCKIYIAKKYKFINAIKGYFEKTWE